MAGGVYWAVGYGRNIVGGGGKRQSCNCGVKRRWKVADYASASSFRDGRWKLEAGSGEDSDLVLFPYQTHPT